MFSKAAGQRQAGQSGELHKEDTRLPGRIYLGSRSWGSLAVGGLSAEASSFGHGCGQGWVLGRRRGADYDGGRHREVGTLCREGLLAPLLQGATHTGSEGPPRGHGLPPELPPPLNLMGNYRQETPELLATVPCIPSVCLSVIPSTHTPLLRSPVGLSIPSRLSVKTPTNLADNPESPH